MYIIILTVFLLSGGSVQGVYTAGTGSPVLFDSIEACEKAKVKNMKEHGPELRSNPEVREFKLECSKA